MFTGIVQGIAQVLNVKDKPGLRSLSLSLPKELRAGLQIGASVSLDGVCLTAAAFMQDSIEFDVMAETLSRTNLGDLNTGDMVNIERSAKLGTEIGGHVISGHIDCKAKLIAISRPENNYILRIEVPKEFMPYIFNKGFVALNGASLTVSNLDSTSRSFEVWLIPETLRVTTFERKKIGDFLNLEIDRNTQVIVDTVMRLLQQHLSNMNKAIGI